MIEQLKWYLVNVGIKKYAPVAMMAGLAALGTLMAAHAGMLESWGVNYIASWSADWLSSHSITGPVLLIELDTTSTAAIASLIGLIGLLSRAGEHHAMANVPTAPPPPPPQPPSGVQPVKLGFILLGLCFWPLRPAQAFNLIKDIQQQTQFPIGQAASAGMAVNLKSGNLSDSALAELVNYRMFSGWYGGTQVNPSDGKMTDTAKIGLNVGYFLSGFVNKPPLILRNMVVGPSIAYSLISTPRVPTYLFDFNFRFGGTTALPPAATPAPSGPVTPQS